MHLSIQFAPHAGLATALLVPVVGGSIYNLLCLWAVLRVRGALSEPAPVRMQWPPVTMLKPVYGLERDLERSLRSALDQDYPTLQVVMSVQRLDDPALPLLLRLAEEYGPERATVIAEQSEPVVNGKVQNLLNALQAARHDILLISDSDVMVAPDYVRRMVAPLADDNVGYVCSLFRAVGAQRWFEKLELLSYNAEFIPSVIFAWHTGASSFCIGATLAFRRRDLEAIGGFEALLHYLVEDYELGRRLNARGLRMVLVPHFVKLAVDLSVPREWWRHQLYWDLNTRAARPIGFAASGLTRAVPFALLYALVQHGLVAIIAFTLALVVRMVTAAGTAAALNDRETLRTLGWLPVRDLVGLLTWAVALGKRSYVWRGHTFKLAANGRIVPRVPYGQSPGSS